MINELLSKYITATVSVFLFCFYGVFFAYERLDQIIRFQKTCVRSSVSVTLLICCVIVWFPRFQTTQARMKIRFLIYLSLQLSWSCLCYFNKSTVTINLYSYGRLCVSFVEFGLLVAALLAEENVIKLPNPPCYLVPVTRVPTAVCVHVWRENIVFEL